MYAYTRDSAGHYTGLIGGERVTAHNREQFMKLAWQADRRREQRQAIATNLAAKRGVRRLAWT